MGCPYTWRGRISKFFTPLHPHHFFWWPILTILDRLWHILVWLIIGVLVTGILGNFAYTYVTTCKPKSCDVSFTDPRGWPILLLFTAHPLLTIATLVFIIVIVLCSYLAHRHLHMISLYNELGITFAHELRVLNLGDNDAASFPYIITPIQRIYDETIKILYDASIGKKGSKRGILLLGESNSGKTRLTLEVLKKILPHWAVLYWSPNLDTTKLSQIDFLRGKNIVVFIDDLQDYMMVP
jgi:hypothetical protein